MTNNYKTFFDGFENKPIGSSQGYPVPGPQSPTSDEIAGEAFFSSSCDWKKIVDEVYDFIVIGTGPTGVAFIEQMLKNNPKAKILVLERGGFWLPTHYQMLPTAFQSTTALPTTTYAWSRTNKMVTTGMELFQAGYMPLFGGRSTYWSAWSPSPSPDQMRDWPKELINITKKPDFWKRAKKFLHVTSTDKINNGIYGSLQKQLDTNLKKNFKDFVSTAEHSSAAPIAVDNPEWKSVSFYKYSTVGTLLNLYEKHKTMANGGTPSLTIVDNCIVERLLHDDNGSAIAVKTSRGILSVNSAKIVLAMGTIPPTTLLMNSFEKRIPNAGKRYTGHFVSHITARVKRSVFKKLSSLEIGATYLDGKNTKGFQYHVQSSAFTTKNPLDDASTIAHEAPDAAAVASIVQLDNSEDYVVFVCASLGEINEKNANNWIKLNSEKNPTTNVSLQLVLGKEDMKLWDEMDKATYETINAMVTSKDSLKGSVDIEYWVSNKDGSYSWKKSKPNKEQVRLNVIVHEASTLWMGKDAKTSVVGLDYRPHGVKNVYVTGGSLFPTSGSWNPTLTMCGFAQDLADNLS